MRRGLRCPKSRHTVFRMGATNNSLECLWCFAVFEMGEEPETAEPADLDSERRSGCCANG